MNTAIFLLGCAVIGGGVGTVIRTQPMAVFVVAVLSVIWGLICRAGFI